MVPPEYLERASMASVGEKSVIVNGRYEEFISPYLGEKSTAPLTTTAACFPVQRGTFECVIPENAFRVVNTKYTWRYSDSKNVRRRRRYIVREGVYYYSPTVNGKL